jgi:hypothetical protein
MSADSIYKKYSDAYDGEIQGCCPLIADEIQKEIGGEIVAGELTWNGGACRRTHWWVVKDGAVIDPMGDHLLSFEDYPGRNEIHRDRTEFDSILPRYEQWRIT